MRRLVVLDKRTNRLLEELAADRGGSLSRVLREAIQVYAHIQTRLDALETNAKFRQMMARSAEDIRAGRVVSLKEMKTRAARRRIR